mmetsp:Transcript_19971/g.30636  ORF Transcript_19971/g.30636 Transcript_19971/m.30636 type:complete len:271 (-) Transcript_19971:1504-2316(-)
MYIALNRAVLHSLSSYPSVPVFLVMLQLFFFESSNPRPQGRPPLGNRKLYSLFVCPSVITAYRPVQIGSGVNPVIQQHKRVLGQNSHPRRQLLQDLANEILKLRRKGDEIILAMDANEEPPQQPNIIWNDFETFCATTGLLDAMTALHGYATTPSCSRSYCTRSLIDFIFCSPSLLRWIRISMLDELSGCPSDHRTFIMDVDTAGLWQRPLPSAPSRLPRGFTSSNKPCTKAFINKLHALLHEANFQQALQAAQEALDQKSSEAELQTKM